MSTLVLGAGVVGITTAYYLALSGEDVTVVDRQPSAGLETSFANGGLITPSMSDPWAAPGLPLKLLRWLGREDAPFLLRLSALPGLTGWGVRFLANCTEAKWRRNAERVLRLAEYSRDALDELGRTSSIEFDRNEDGTLMVFRDELSLRATEESASMLHEIGVVHRTLDTAQCVAAEPALESAAADLRGGMLFPMDRSGDAFKFTQSLAAACEGHGVEFRYDVNVHAIHANGDRIDGVATDAGVIATDRYVVALGSYSAPMVKPLGIGLPIYPVKGYSVTLELQGWNKSPRIPVVDHGRKLAVTPLGNRLRAAGTAEFNGFDRTPNRRRGQLLIDALKDLYPEVRVPENVDIWTGLRPVTPDGPPLLGRTPYRNLFLNCGQGHLGWTMACGSARVLADILTGSPPEIDLDGLTIDRFD